MAAFLTAVSACAKPLAVIAVLTAIALWLRKYSEPNSPDDDDLMAIVDAVLAGPADDDLLEPANECTWTVDEIRHTCRIHLLAAIRADQYGLEDWGSWDQQMEDVQ